MAERLGFACVWEHHRARTWSHIPWPLRAALRNHVELVDCGVDLSRVTRALLKAPHVRRGGDSLVSLWRSSTLTDRYVERALAREVARQRPDALLQVLDLATVESVPAYLLRDMSWDLIRRLRERFDFATLGHPGFTSRRLDERCARERELYERSAGLLVFSGWLADDLVERGHPRGKVHVIHPGTTSILDESVAGPADARLRRPRERLLFVGADFKRKAGDLVVEAFTRVRRQRPGLTLTIVGPQRWPLNTPIPEGVEFRGRLAPSAVAPLFRDSDLFVMPSRFEAYGIVFAEALAVGMPAIARDDFAMPEIVRAGHNGALVSDDDPDAVAATILETLDDDAIYERCAAEAADRRAFYSWDRAARDVLAAIGSNVGAG